MVLTKAKLNEKRRVRIKICGITRLEDALHAASLGVDALGFVFYRPSPRYISPTEASKIIKALPPFVSVVGLFVNPAQSDIDDVLQACPLDIIQLHGDEPAAFCAAQKLRVMKALSISTVEDLQQIPKYKCSVLLDAKAPEGVYGGTGQTFDWSLLESLEHDYPLVLAGGLNAENVKDALALNVVSALDVSSGVEQSKGIKDDAKVSKFCQNVHQFNCKV
ncbi:MAG: phosphoribosylanthranilate isomerase [Ghiorsea sp.]